MICHRCQNIPLDLFLGNRSIQYELHHSLKNFRLSADLGCLSCRILLEQRASQIDHGFNNTFHYLTRDGGSYWIEWDNQEDQLVLASGQNHYFLDYDSEPGFRTTDVTPDLSPASSSGSLRIIRLWLDKCLGEHNCHSGDGTLPTRLLDVGPVDGSQDPRIVYGAQVADQRAQYLALSYCWGQTTKQSPWTLTGANIDDFKRGIQTDQLPQSFCDIIKLTRALGERFVWIDALCILQDSAEDWEKEATLMASIYTNALCTVVSPASDPTQSLFVKRDSSRTRPASLQLSPRNGGPSAAVRLHPVLPKWNVGPVFGIEDMNESGLQANQPTRKRAWCLQEYELSRRTVTFTTHQFAWVCREMQCSEEEFSLIPPTLATSANDDNTSLPLAMTHIENLLYWPFHLFNQVARFLSFRWGDGWTNERPLQIPRFNRKLTEPPGLYRKWEKLVEEYTARHLSKPSDRLCAVAGLAKQRHQETNDQYLVGLWKSNLKSELLWRVENPAQSSRIAELSSLPTWSWVAVDSPVYFPHRPYALRWSESRMPSPVGDEISIEKVEVNTAGRQTFTETTSARITMKGKLMRASIRNVEDPNSRDYRIKIGWELVDASKQHIGRIFLDNEKLFPENSAIECLWVNAGIVQDADLEPRYTGGFGLALSHKQDAEDEVVYTRIGFVQFSSGAYTLGQIHKVKISRFTLV